MKKYFYLIRLLLISFSACKKDKSSAPTDPVVTDSTISYTNLGNLTIGFNAVSTIDLNGDGTTDFSFSTLLVGDPVLQRDRRQYYGYSKVGADFLNNPDNESPILNRGDSIKQHHEGFTWFEVSARLLAEKIISLNGNDFWQGSWKNAHHNYLPLRIKSNGAYFYGWIELSFNIQNEQVILHRAALCKTADKPIKAG